jgi:hypothetical protein
VDEEGFVACCRGGEGSGGQIHQFISDFSDLIVPKSHETSFLASERMLKREMGVTAVALVREVINASRQHGVLTVKCVNQTFDMVLCKLNKIALGGDDWRISVQSVQSVLLNADPPVDSTQLAMVQLWKKCSFSRLLS